MVYAYMHIVKVELLCSQRHLLCELYLCNHVHTLVPCTTHLQYVLVMWPIAQLKTAVMTIFVVHWSTLYMVLLCN